MRFKGASGFPDGYSDSKRVAFHALYDNIFQQRV